MNYLIDAYQKTKTNKFFSSPAFLKLLVGNDQLISQIEQGKSSSEINDSWKVQLEEFLLVRSKYLVYP
mgnify:CR=1 FL=1